MITRSLDELSILDRMVLDFTQVSYLVASINTDEPRKVLNAIKSYIKSWHLLFYREISYIVDLLSWNTIVGKIYYRDSTNQEIVHKIFLFSTGPRLMNLNHRIWMLLLFLHTDNPLQNCKPLALSNKLSVSKGAYLPPSLQANTLWHSCQRVRGKNLLASQ